ncbi:bifunctional glutamate N-acetyltransferase/amino-acid acetyltransferase ArgJ [Homoserinimonas sp. OAct 916]|uniref:bifunctional glutamate N-acetyltransferase/amino-acid acetyltransferase ArgJ n=1 Tax=Homoserinimonas sp. OAct 916 TaxID=2211450 RepID=UPI000DBE95AE|nr:bifunctional glutamate N-acetyltransferase/amino-acid acetyltransferase ArgJ [Homoserinimonas sp. OAct 916]
MTVTTPQGFEAAGVSAGLKASGGLDLALVVNRGPQPAVAAVFTSNRAQANPILWSKKVIQDGAATAIVLNSGGANCFTGSQGYETTRATAAAVAHAVGIDTGNVLVCSTGLIGEQLDRAKLTAGVAEAAVSLSASGGDDAARAIMTTDSVPKSSVHIGDGWSIGGIAKGAGMLAPGLATMLVVVTTDAVLGAAHLDTALREACRLSFDRLDSDGCMSTNDQVTLMASGASGVEPDAAAFQTALTELCHDLSEKLQMDAEGSSHCIDIEVVNAATEDDAVEVGRSVARNNLFKAAVFGNDPNWGRVLAAIGTTQAEFDPYRVDVTINDVRVCANGGPDQPRELVDLTPRRAHVLIDLKAGEKTAMIFSNDLTHEYVHENSAYSS